MNNPIRPTDDAARQMARDLLNSARFGALATLDPETGGPIVTRVAIGTSPTGAPLSLVSDLSSHTQALRLNPQCSLLVGEPGPKGDPLTHPRLTIQTSASFINHSDPGFADLAAHYLKTHPKAQLYISFTDFSFVLFTCQRAFLNGGFGKAFHLTPADLDQ